jgi:hypothetical protein
MRQLPKWIKTSPSQTQAGANRSVSGAELERLNYGDVQRISKEFEGVLNDIIKYIKNVYYNILNAME